MAVQDLDGPAWLLENRKAVWWVVNKHGRPGHDPDELFQVASLACLEAAPKWRPGMRARLSWWVVTAMKFAVRRAEQKRMKGMLGTLRGSRARRVSRTTAVREGALSVAPPTEDSLAMVEAIGIALRAHGLLGCPRWQAVIEARFMEGKTLACVACEMGVTRERVRQIECMALKEMRREIVGRCRMSADECLPIDPPAPSRRTPKYPDADRQGLTSWQRERQMQRTGGEEW